MHELLEALGPAGRTRYLEMLWTVDLALPLLFGLLLWSAVSRGALRRSRWVALSAATADYLENVAITALLLAYPAQHALVASLASALTVAKLSLYLAAVMLAVRGAWLEIRARRRMDRDRASSADFRRPAGSEVS